MLQAQDAQLCIALNIFNYAYYIICVLSVFIIVFTVFFYFNLLSYGCVFTL